MAKVHRDNSFVFFGWMKTELGLKSTELIIYAIIYGFSQTEEQVYHEGLEYLADWAGVTERSARNAINSLIGKGYIFKKDIPGFVSELVAIRPCQLTPEKISAPPRKNFPPTPEKISAPPRKNFPPTPENFSSIPIDKSDRYSDYQSVCQSETINNFSTVENVENSDRQTDGLPPKSKRSTYEDMLRMISSPLADNAFAKSENDLSDMDEDMRLVRQCQLPLEIKENRYMFQQALRYLMAYSYRFPEEERLQNEDLQDFADTVIDELSGIAYYGRYNGKSASYELIIHQLNEINQRLSLYDWILNFYDDWKTKISKREIINAPAYLRSCVYTYLREYKIKNIFPNPF